MKDILVVGCSISSDITCIYDEEKSNALSKNHRSYPSYLKDNGYNVENLSISGLDNTSISRLVIHKINQLLKNGKKSDELFVLVQWSGVDRISSFVTEDETVDWPELWKFNFIDNLNGDLAVNRGKTGGAFWDDYKNLLYTEEGFFIKTLENILRTQWFLKSMNIKYKMFTGWDIFTFSTGKEGGYGIHHPNGGQFLAPEYKTDEDGNDVLVEKNYENIENQLLKDKFKNSTHLWDMIDFDNFWTFNNDCVKFGGMVQWVENNFTHKADGFRGGSPFDFHPANVACQYFCSKVLIPMIEEVIDEKNN